MKHLIFTLLLIANATAIYAQQQDYEEIKQAAVNFENAELSANDSLIKINAVDACKKMIDIFKNNPELLSADLSQNKRIIKTLSDDNKVVCVTTMVKLKDESCYYCGFIAYLKGENDITFTQLIQSENKENPMFTDYNCTNWYGAVYYEIIKAGGKKDPEYAFLGWDGADLFINRKVFEQVKFNSEDIPIWGGNFECERRKGCKRLVFEYSEKAAMSLTYNKKMKMITADHLSPSMPKYSGNPAFYGPDFSFDGWIYEDSVWRYLPDIDAKN